MNVSLLDPVVLLQDYPESLTHVFSYGQSTTVKFNRKGDYLASGLEIGFILIIDFDTNNIVSVLKSHTSSIQSLEWSRDGRYLLSSSRDWKVILWDLKTQSIAHSVRLEAPVWSAQLDPRQKNRFVAALYEDLPVLVEFNEKKSAKRIPLPATSSTLSEQTKKEIEVKNTTKRPDKTSTLCVVFHPEGKFIFSGTSKGYINVFNSDTGELAHSTRLANSNVKNIVFSPRGRTFVANCSDRVIRQVQTPNLNLPPNEWEFEVQHKFQDVVNKLRWNAVTYSSTGEYIAATTYADAQDIYIWETTVGSLVKILEGPKEELVEVQWHPNRPTVVATGLDDGSIYVWSIPIPPKWSALAPDFVEIEDNIEYDEREDEFDIAPEEAVSRQKEDEEDVNLDVLTIQRQRGEYEEESFVIPLDLTEPELDMETLYD